MSDLLEKIDSDLKEAMKQRDELKVSTLRFLKSALHNLTIERQGRELEEGDIFDVLGKQIKMRKDAVEGFQKGNREDLAKKESDEIDILKKYLPEPISEEELKKVIVEEIEALEVKDKSAFGKVMKTVLSRVKGRAESKIVSGLVGQMLNK